MPVFKEIAPSKIIDPSIAQAGQDVAALFPELRITVEESESRKVRPSDRLKVDREAFFKRLLPGEIFTGIFGESYIAEIDAGVSEDDRKRILEEAFSDFIGYVERINSLEQGYSDHILMDFGEFLSQDQCIAQRLARNIIDMDMNARDSGHLDNAFNSSFARYYYNWTRSNGFSQTSGVLSATLINSFTIDSLGDNLDIFELFLRFHIEKSPLTDLNEENTALMYETRKRLWELLFFDPTIETNRPPIRDADLIILRERLELIPTNSGIVDDWSLGTDVGGTASPSTYSYTVNPIEVDSALHNHELIHLLMQGRSYTSVYDEEQILQRLITGQSAFAQVGSFVEVMTSMCERSVSRGSFIVDPTQFIAELRIPWDYFPLKQVFATVLSSLPTDVQGTAIRLMWESYFENIVIDPLLPPEGGSAFDELSTFFNTHFEEGFIYKLNDSFSGNFISVVSAWNALDTLSRICAKRGIPIDTSIESLYKEAPHGLDTFQLTEEFIIHDKLENIEYSRSVTHFLIRHKENPFAFIRYELVDGVLEITHSNKHNWFYTEKITKDFIATLDSPVTHYLIVHPHLQGIHSELLSDLTNCFNYNPYNRDFKLIGLNPIFLGSFAMSGITFQESLPQINYVLQSLGVDSPEFRALPELFEVTSRGLLVCADAGELVPDGQMHLGEALDRMPGISDASRAILETITYLRHEILNSNITYDYELARALGSEALRVRHAYVNRTEVEGISPEIIELLLKHEAYDVPRIASISQGRLDIARLAPLEFHQAIASEKIQEMDTASRIVLADMENSNSVLHAFTNLVQARPDLRFDYLAVGLELGEIYISILKLESEGRDKREIVQRIYTEFSRIGLYVRFFDLSWLQRFNWVAKNL
ncbi:MAG: hypothetical protein M3Q44_07900 [bacterium]|nr:hypothetical protein [bacterium]